MADEQNKQAEQTTPAADAAPKKKAGKKSVPHGNIYINASFNNTLVSVTDPVGNVLSWSSSGSKGFRGSRKKTPFAAQIAAEEASRKAIENGMRTAQVFVNGPGAGRETALRAIQTTGIRVTMIRDITPIPHNGCRPPKKRRG